MLKSLKFKEDYVSIVVVAVVVALFTIGATVVALVM